MAPTIASSCTSASSSTARVDEPQALRAQRDLLDRFLAGDVQGPARSADRGHRLQQQRRLADAGIAAEQDHAAGDEAAAQHAVEFLDAGRQRADCRCASTLASARTTLAPPASAWKRDAGVAAIVSTSVFQTPQCGHWPCHLLLWPPHSVQA